MSVHESSRAYDRVADRYEHGRPGYAAEVIEHLTRTLDLAHGRAVLDLAAGTGKLTRALVATGAEVIAVEPIAGMRAELAARLTAVTVLDGTAEAIPLPDDAVDAVTVAQAFQWFEPALALDEIARVLRPGGALALVWNERDQQQPLNAATTALLAPYRGGTPRLADRAFEPVLDTDPRFDREVPFTTATEQSVDEATFLDRFLSVSFVANLPNDDRARLADALAAAFAAHAPSGTTTLHYTTEVHVLRLREPATPSP